MHSVKTAVQSTAVSRRGILLAAGALASGASALALSACSGQDVIDAVTGKQDAQAYAGSTFAFDTYCTFTVYGDATAPAKLASACARYDDLFDLYDEKSDIARINAAGGKPVKVARETIDVLERALPFCKASGGLFDITIGTVSTLWDFDQHVRPADDAIAAALPHIGWQNIKVDKDARTVTLADPATKIDLGGIAKGYIADRLVEILKNKTKAVAGVISLGGNIAYYGSKPGGGRWNTGIRDPNDPGGTTTVGTARVTGGSVVTSGLYERTFTQDGTTYWHILDPRTGMPVQTDVVSDTVICPSSTAADALSTTLFVAGSEAGAKIADGRKATAAYFIKNDGSTAESKRWQELSQFES